ncbi:MAG: hypothetical protein ACI9KS_001553 [Sulfitobacter sp.]|jgi:hypothetical protein
MISPERRITIQAKICSIGTALGNLDIIGFPADRSQKGVKMRRKSGARIGRGEQVVENLCQATRKQYST